ncbi:MAG: hypothetical protein KJO55_04710, partial [Gammaproteobacteria bacterium]|nr:hypothetical protein [Gammaproteobacteria bacterium]
DFFDDTLGSSYKQQLEDIDAIGLHVQEAALQLAIVGEIDSGDGLARSWTGIAGEIAAIGVVGLPDGFEFAFSNLKFLVNLADGTTPGNSDDDFLDWKKVSESSDTYDLENTELKQVTRDTRLFVGGDFMVSIDNFIYVSGSVALERKELFAKTVGSTSSTKMSVLAFGAQSVRAFVGVGETDTLVEGELDDVDTLNQNAIGVHLMLDEFALVLMKPVTPVTEPATDPSTKSYFSLKASGGAELVGVDAVQLAGTLNLSVNSASDSAAAEGAVVPVIDYAASAATNPGPYGSSTGLKVATGTGDSDFLIVDFDEDLLEASGSVTLTIDEFVHVSGEFAFKKTTEQVVTDENGDTIEVNALTIGANNVNAFVGVGGPYFVDSNGDGKIDETDERQTDGAMGLVLDDLEFALALFKPTVDAGSPNSAAEKARSYYALKASGGAEIVGIDGITIRADLIGVEVNGASTSEQSAPVPPAIDFVETYGAAGLAVDTGPDPDGEGGIDAPSINLDFVGTSLRAFGDVTLIIDNFVYISGEFEFSKSSVPQSVNLTDGTTKTVNILTVGANEINAFFGTGDPDSNGDGMFDLADDPEANGAIGLQIQDFDFGLALLKPVATADRSSYYALEASAANISLVGVPGVILGANSLAVSINGASVPSSGAATPTGPPPPVVNFASSFGSGSGLEVGTGEGAPTITIDLSTRLLRASASQINIGLDFDLDTNPEILFVTDVSFEQATRPNGSPITKIGLDNMSLTLGEAGPDAFTLGGLSGFIVLVDGGVAASIGVDNIAYNAMLGGANIAISGSASVQIKTIDAAIVNEEFVINGETKTLNLQAGKYLRVEGSLNISVNFNDGAVESEADTFTLGGHFALEQISLVDPDGDGPLPAPKAIKIGATGVTVTVLGAGLTEGQGGFIFLPDGIAGSMRVTVSSGDPGATGVGLNADVILEINTTGRQVNHSIAVGNQLIAINFGAGEENVVRFAILNASIEIPPFFELTGDFTVQSLSDRTLYGARNVELFIGYVPDGGSLRDENGEVKDGAIGLRVTNGTLGMVKLTTEPGQPAKYAVYAFGEASFIGLDDLTISGTITIRLNNTGQVIDQLIEMPQDPLATVTPDMDGIDNNGNDLVDEDGETTAIRVKFDSTAKIEEFSAGFNEQGDIAGDGVVISAAGIFTISGAVSFSRTPTGKVNVDLPQAAVTIKIPDGNELVEAFSISGAARFSFGGEQGFSLEDIRVSGYSIFGQGADIAAPASSLRNPGANLASPSNIAIVDIDDLDALYVAFEDPNREGLD